MTNVLLLFYDKTVIGMFFFSFKSVYEKCETRTVSPVDELLWSEIVNKQTLFYGKWSFFNHFMCQTR